MCLNVGVLGFDVSAFDDTHIKTMNKYINKYNGICPRFHIKSKEPFWINDICTKCVLDHSLKLEFKEKFMTIMESYISWKKKFMQTLPSSQSIYTHMQKSQRFYGNIDVNE